MYHRLHLKALTGKAVAVLPKDYRRDFTNARWNLSCIPLELAALFFRLIKGARVTWTMMLAIMPISHTAMISYTTDANSSFLYLPILMSGSMVFNISRYATDKFNSFEKTCTCFKWRKLGIVLPSCGRPSETARNITCLLCASMACDPLYYSRALTKKLLSIRNLNF